MAQQTISRLLKLTDDSVNRFVAALTPIQRDTYKRLIELSKELDIYVDGTLKNNLNNIKILSRIRPELEQIILSDAYITEVKEFTDAYGQIQKLQNSYFSSITTKFSPKAVFNEVKKIAVDNTIENLTESGIGSNYLDSVKKILQNNITGGGSFSDLTKQLSDYVLGDKDTDGGLVRYAKQVTTDSINQFSAEYNRIVSDDLNLKFYQYVGSLITTSRPFCKAMVEKRYFHISEVPELLRGNINGKKVPLNDNTGLPQGFIAGTNAATFFINRAGYSCGHQIFPVAESSVPQAIRDKFI